jgi:hypothetical protein
MRRGALEQQRRLLFVALYTLGASWKCLRRFNIHMPFELYIRCGSEWSGDERD